MCSPNFLLYFKNKRHVIIEQPVTEEIILYVKKKPKQTQEQQLAPQKSASASSAGPLEDDYDHIHHLVS